MLNMARSAFELTGSENLCLAGGVALNCVGNGRIHREGPFKRIWVQPAAGDAGGALGAALLVWHKCRQGRRAVNPNDSQKGSYLGPSYSDAEIETFLDKRGAAARHFDSVDELISIVAALLEEGKVVGWFDGRMEFGPRALGARSILGDARSPEMQRTINLKIKYRESFRPFAPIVLEEKVSDWFDHEGSSPYMLFVAPVAESRRLELTAEDQAKVGTDLLNVARSQIPAVTHVNYSARLQTVHERTNPRMAKLLRAFEARTGCPVLVNTSFNVRGEPIVCTPDDAYRCFLRTEMDVLVLGDRILHKEDQSLLEEVEDWRNEFVLD